MENFSYEKVEASKKTFSLRESFKIKKKKNKEKFLIFTRNEFQLKLENFKKVKISINKKYLENATIRC